MKKFLLALVSALALLASPALAGVGAMGNNIIWYNSPTTLATVLSGYCSEGNLAISLDTGIYYKMNNCAGSASLSQVWPVLASDVSGLSAAISSAVGSSYEGLITGGTTAQYWRGDKTWQTLNAVTVGLGNVTNTSDANKPVSTAQASALAAKLDVPSGTSAQYLDGTGAVKSFSSTSRTFNYPARALNSCFQVSATNDADVNYSVNVSATLTLGGGTGVVTTYTNSGCSTGTQVVFNGAVSSVALLGTSSIPLHAIVPGGKWAKITATASGGGTAAIDTVQAETILP